MIWLLLSILCSTIIILLFKVFEKHNINTFQAIIVNYFTCVVVGLPLVSKEHISFEQLNWLPIGLVLGALFIGLFFLIGRTAQRNGVAVASVSMKLGYVLPIALAFLVYKESFSWLHFIGILLTVLAVILSSYPGKEQGQQTVKASFLFPIIIFVGSGIADSLVQYAEKTYFGDGGFEFFNIVLFGTAALLGLIAYIINSLRKKQFVFQWKDLIAGIVLGIPNYGSIYFMIKALNVPHWDSAFVFPVNNIGIVISAALFAFLLFKEKLNSIKLIGLLLAVVSIVLMAI